MYFIYVTIIFSVAFMFYFNRKVMRESPGTEKMQHIAELIQKGAMQFLKVEYSYIGIFVIVTSIALCFLFGLPSAISFIIGSFSSAFAGFLGMSRSVRANVRAANAARRSLNESLKVSLYAGSTVGLGLVTIGIVGLLIIISVFPNNLEALLGYSFGVASIALFARVGGGIYTKAADVGADLVGKIEAKIPEDDPRNPAVIADNVGDNVGDTAGMGADLFDSLIVNLVAAMAIGALIKVGDSAVEQIFDTAAFIFPIFVVSAGILAAIFGTFFSNIKSKKPSRVLANAFLITCAVMIGIVFILNGFFFSNLNVFAAVVIGVLAGIGLGKATEYYTSYNFRPVKGIVESSKIGAATNIIHGLSVGKRSTFSIVGILMAAIYISHIFAGIYGVAMAGVGMLALAAIIMAIDVFGPVVDNAGGIAEMAGLPKKVRNVTDELDAAGNTTAAIGKGFAIGSAALAALALLTLFAQEAGLSMVNLLNFKVMIGLFIGALIPYLFSSYVLLAVGDTALKVAQEVRRQFRTIEGIMEGKKEPDYNRSIDIATKAALKKMIIPGLIVISTPILVGLILGSEALGASLAGTLVTGVLLGIKQSNSGSAWDNAKKLVEKGLHGGKGSATHFATVIGDTVGDPKKDTSGPSLNIVIKLTILVATVFVTFF
ncbi:MAG: sodium-translocating pyrophosphatase [Candidatus Pacebacteria bacterium]|nr:sodium-translocating pyrophosphatase [Candidatus Paceibacterota bacterium]|tara:strand:+ start:5084 stop:7057 length:1974 start_codon:yes stop_codon:yes gene_type:complete